MNYLLLAYDACDEIKPILSVIKKGVFPLIQIGIPIILIVLGTLDLGKAVISSDDKEVKAAQGRLIKRLIYAAVIFFMVTFVSLVMSIVSTSDSTDVSSGTGSWRECWDSVK